MLIEDTRKYPPLFTLPRWKRRWRLRHIIAVRRKGRTPAIGLRLRLQGWQAGTPIHPERFTRLLLRTGKYSVRDHTHTIPICKLQDWAVEDVMRRRR